MKAYRLEYSQEQGSFHQEDVNKESSKRDYLTLSNSVENILALDFIEAMHQKYPALAVGSQMKDEFPSFEEIKDEFIAYSYRYSKF